MFSATKTRTSYRELPKTDNTYCPTSKYYGCTLAPGIPLIPNLCRRPLRSPGDDNYDYTFTPPSIFVEENHANHHNRWLQNNNFVNKKLDNTNGNSHLGLMKLPQRRLNFHDSGLDSDSDLEESLQSKEHLSQNTVTWLSWIITAVTTVVTVITETIVGRESHHNHVNNRVPLKQKVGVAWYQYPVLWLYKTAMYIHQMDIWLLHKVNSTLRVDSWGTSQQRRKWALMLLLIPLVIWAGFKLVDWLWDDNSSAEGLALFSPLFSLLSSAWEGVTGWFSSAWEWFDGSWLKAPWLLVAGWFQSSVEEASPDESIEATSGIDWSAVFTSPYNSVAALFVSLGEFVGNVLSTLGEGAVTVFSAIGGLVTAFFIWIVDFFTSIPTFFSSVISLVTFPFKSVSWESAPVESSALPPSPVYSAQFSASPPSPEASLDHLLRDKQLLSLLFRNLLSSEEFNQALAERQSSNQEQVNLAVDRAFTAAFSKINVEFSRVKEELNDKISLEENSVETKMNSLKQQIHELEMALMAHKALVSEQAALGNRLEARVTNAEQLKIHEGQDHASLKEQILLEVAKVKEEISDQLLKVQLNQKVVVGGSPVPNPSELETFVNSTVERLLAIYDADKIAKVDYALASSGGSVLNVRCTETFSKKNAQYYMWGYPLWSKSANDPKIALEPAINPGECWAFTGSRGYMVIELSENISVTAFTMEHLPRSLSPSGSIDTAPKEFTVLGLESEQDETPILLGKFTYEDNGVSLQHYQALVVDHAFKIVELVIESNHGNLEYTCLYRFRVHGHPVRQL